MRSFAVILCVALSGLPSLAAEALERGGAADACTSCPGETPSDSDSSEPRDCSPMCPDCVCSLGARTALPALLVLSAPELTPLAGVSAAMPAAASPPRAPALDGVFHPPKR
ncbi:MAG: hypothetical protein A2138_12755 [Deltaproteobacteria bacterium RBG_16_71_12]|nr:MAG: hypothetical protein A2138_12755 [Deltaproteobacteria bacterium RBG_16_71_12]